jgi:NADPH2:quinone reductase
MIARSYGGSAALESVDEPTPEPGNGQVVIAVKAAGTNPSDCKQLSGAFGTNADNLPLRPGAEVSGVVTAVGPDALAAHGLVRVGDEVVAYRVSGGFADEVLVSAKSVFAKPSGLSWNVAAGLLLTGATAWHLVEATGIGPGDTVVVHGASGAVGSLAVQLAVQRGAVVIGTASLANHGAVRDLGALPVEYGEGLVARIRQLAPDGVDAALDTVGTDEAIESSVELTGDPLRVATINAFTRGAELGVLRLGAAPGADPGTGVRNAARQPLLDLAAAGRLTVRLGATYPLAEAAAALALLETGHPDGKVTLVP